MSDDLPYARPLTMAAIAVLVLAMIGADLLFDSGLRLEALVLALSIPYLALTTIGWRWSEQRGGAVLRAHLAITFALTLVLLWTSDQSLFMFVFPPLLFVVLHAGVRWGVVGIVAIAATAAAQNAQMGYSAANIYLRSTGFVPGAILLIAFAVTLRREREARRGLAELAATRERNRIARDIHDSVGHYLTVVHVQIEAARATVAKDAATADECLGRAQDLAKDGLAELRRSVSMLRAGAPEQRPFGVALAQLVDDTRAAGVLAALTVEGAVRALPPAIEFALYRAAQEGLTNVARHARATVARCTLRYGARDVRLRLEDGGVGAVEPSGGFGLVGVRERVGAIGGTVDVRTAPGR